MKLLSIALVATMALVGVTQTYARVGTLAECYERVIADCKDNAPSCARSGMAECDQVYATPLPRNPGLFFGDEPGETIR